MMMMIQELITLGMLPGNEIYKHDVKENENDDDDENDDAMKMMTMI